MKFVLGLVALVLVGLLLYVYTGKENKQLQKQTVHKTVKEVTPAKVEVTSVEKKVSEKVKPVVQHTVKKESLKVSNTSNSDGEIGEDLTLESIENADLSDKEKDRLLGELVSYEIYKVRNEPSAFPEEDLERLKQTIEKNLK